LEENRGWKDFSQAGKGGFETLECNSNRFKPTAPYHKEEAPTP
jgi:hypothetical protein